MKQVVSLKQGHKASNLQSPFPAMPPRCDRGFGLVPIPNVGSLEPAICTISAEAQASLNLPMLMTLSLRDGSNCC